MSGVLLSIRSGVRAPPGSPLKNSLNWLLFAKTAHRNGLNSPFTDLAVFCGNTHAIVHSVRRQFVGEKRLSPAVQVMALHHDSNILTALTSFVNILSHPPP
jgi:hypothetical protein